MRHLKSGRRLNRSSAHRKAMFTNLACALIKHEQIKTTLPKAKDLRPAVEKLVTSAKNGKNSLHARRLLLSRMGDAAMVTKLFDVLALRYAQRNGGSRPGQRARTTLALKARCRLCPDSDRR